MALYKFAVGTAVAYTVFGAGTSQQCLRGELCLSSFKQCDSLEEGCGKQLDSHAWADPDGTVHPPTLFGDTDYIMTWVFGPNGQVDVPVRIQWQMNSVIWEIYTTEAQYIFNPGKILASFPTPQAPNMTLESAWFYASHFSGNMLIISQPEAVGVGDDFPITLTQPFTVQPKIAENYIQAQINISQQTEYIKWRLGVSIGLGIGIPLLIVATTIGVLALAKMQARRHSDAHLNMVSHDTLY